MTVHILSPDGTDFGINRATAIVGFTLKGAEVREFEIDAFEDLPLGEGDIVVAGIHLAHQAMARLGIPVPALDSVPASLLPFAGRRIWRADMREARALVQAGEHVFIKPAPSRHKLFGGYLAREFRDLIPTAHIGDDETVDLAEPMDFVSEYRCFVADGMLLGVRHYKGDPLIFPDAGVVRNAIAAYSTAPRGYALDIGVVAEQGTFVVEVNDGYSSAAYGLPPIRYASVIEARWSELWLARKRR